MYQSMAVLWASLSVMMGKRYTWVRLLYFKELTNEHNINMRTLTFFLPIVLGTSEGILEWNVITRDSLTEICIRYIRKRRDMWDSLGWDMTALPADLQEIIPVTSPRKCSTPPRTDVNGDNNISNDNDNNNNNKQPPFSEQLHPRVRCC